MSALIGGVGNDNISSLRVAPGYRVTLYDNQGFSGASYVIGADYADLNYASFNNRTSSIRIETVQVPAIAYADADFLGAAQGFWGVGNYDWQELTAYYGIGNDKMSSMRVIQGYKVTLYDNAGFSGTSKVITADTRNFKDISLNDKVSSLKIETINPVDSTSVQVSAYDDNFKMSMLNRFAPKIWMASGETYWASSVEWALPNLQRYYSTKDNKYCYKTVQTLSSPTAKLPYFSGNQASAVAYSFWVEKDFGNIDLSYWQFCPYNFGKVVVGQEFGDHVGDWEHITVRLAKFSYNGVNYVKPIMVVYPYHSSKNIYNWADVSKVAGTDHPIGYSAKESHGMWKDAGNHVYQDIVVAQLTDECSAGTAWDTWNTLRTYEWFPRSWYGRGLGGTTLPAYFSDDYSNPNNGAIVSNDESQRHNLIATHRDGQRRFVHGAL